MDVIPRAWDTVYGALTSPSVNYKPFALCAGLIGSAFDIYLVFRQLRAWQKLRASELAKEQVQQSVPQSDEAPVDLDHGAMPSGPSPAAPVGKTTQQWIWETKVGMFSKLYGQAARTAVVAFDVHRKLWEISGSLTKQMGLDVSRLNLVPQSVLSSLLFTDIVYFLETALQVGIVLADKGVPTHTAKFVHKMTIAISTGLIRGSLLHIAKRGAILLAASWVGERTFVQLWCAGILLFPYVLAIVWPCAPRQTIFQTGKPLPEGEVRDKIEVLAAKFGFPMDNICVVSGNDKSMQGNAMCIGILGSKYIAIHETLIHKRSPDEVAGVVAHELGHWKLGHFSKGIIGRSPRGVILLTFLLFMNDPRLYTSFGFGSDIAEQEQPVGLAFYLFESIGMCAQPLWTVLVNLHRQHAEYAADAFAASLGYGAALASSLLKSENEDSDWLGNDSLFMRFTKTHPAADDRVRAMGLSPSDFASSL